MKVEMHFLSSGIILFLLAVTLSILEHLDKMPILNLWGSAKKKTLGKEKRIFPRYETSLRIKYKSNGVEGTSWLANISRGGAGILLDRAVEAEAPLALEISLPTGSESLFLKGKVVWQKDTHAGIRFDELNTEELNKIFSYLGDKYNLGSIAA